MLVQVWYGMVVYVFHTRMHPFYATSARHHHVYVLMCMHQKRGWLQYGMVWYGMVPYHTRTIVWYMYMQLGGMVWYHTLGYTIPCTHRTRKHQALRKGLEGLPKSWMLNVPQSREFIRCPRNTYFYF